MAFRGVVISASKTVAVAAATMTAVLGGSAAAYAQSGQVGPAVSATPSTGLNDGDTIVVRVTEFAEDSETVLVAQCASVQIGGIVCNNPDSVRLVTDLGTGSTGLLVRTAFTGYKSDGTIWGPVDCRTASGGCIVFARTLPPGVKATTPISFR